MNPFFSLIARPFLTLRMITINPVLPVGYALGRTDCPSILESRLLSQALVRDTDSVELFCVVAGSNRAQYVGKDIVDL